MKKFITLLLVLTGYVSTASADAVTRRFMVIKQVDWSAVTMYASYKNATDEEVAITEGWPGTAMTHWKYESSKDVWYIDLSIPDGVTTIKVAFNDGTSGGSHQTWDYTNLDISSEDKLFYIYDDSGENHGISPVALDYYISGWKEGESDHSDNYRQKLAFNSDGTYTCVLDFTSYTATGNRVIVPFFASGESDGHPWVDWNFTIRPVYSTAKIAFEDKNSTLQLDGTQCWTFKNQVKYKCTFNFVANTWKVESYFERTLPAAAEGFATFSSDYDVIPDASLTAVQYASDINASTGKITWSNFAATGIKAGEGALLTGTAGNTYKFTPATSAVTPGTNYLKAINATTAASALPQHPDGSHTNFILSKVSGQVGFYKVNEAGSWVNEGTAYLQVNNGSLAREFFALDDEGTTAIESVKKEQKMNGEYFNLAGLRVNQPTRGLYIVNGKKVIIK